MPQPPIFKPNKDNLQNAISAVVGRAVKAIKRFATALHNRCNLVVYVDGDGRTCSTFLKKDAFSGYNFQFDGDNCFVTNKETGDKYTVTFTSCTCKAHQYAPFPKQPCKHMKMVSNLATKNKALASKTGGCLRFALLQALDTKQTIHYAPPTTQEALPYFSSFPSVGDSRGDLDLATRQEAHSEVPECTHPRFVSGLDAHYCPDCKKSIEHGTAPYEQLLTRGGKPKAINIDPADVPKGCRLERSDDWISIEYYVHVWQERNIRGERTLIQENIGRLVETSKGIYTHRARSRGSVSQRFDSTRDAIAYLVRIVGMNFDAIAQACEQKELRRTR